MIRKFADRNTARLWRRERVLPYPPELWRTMLRKLSQLDAAIRLEDLKSPPGNRLKKLSGDREGQHSIRINDQWRICFRWHGLDAYDVEIVDYH